MKFLYTKQTGLAKVHNFLNILAAIFVEAYLQD
jgi:hypothetical protein